MNSINSAAKPFPLFQGQSTEILTEALAFLEKTELAKAIVTCKAAKQASLAERLWEPIAKELVGESQLPAGQTWRKYAIDSLFTLQNWKRKKSYTWTLSYLNPMKHFRPASPLVHLKDWTKALLHNGIYYDSNHLVHIFNGRELLTWNPFKNERIRNQIFLPETSRLVFKNNLYSLFIDTASYENTRKRFFLLNQNSIALTFYIEDNQPGHDFRWRWVRYSLVNVVNDVQDINYILVLYYGENKEEFRLNVSSVNNGDIFQLSALKSQEQHFCKKLEKKNHLIEINDLRVSVYDKTSRKLIWHKNLDANKDYSLLNSEDDSCLFAVKSDFQLKFTFQIYEVHFDSCLETIELPSYSDFSLRFSSLVFGSHNSVAGSPYSIKVRDYSATIPHYKKMMHAFRNHAEKVAEIVSMCAWGIIFGSIALHIFALLAITIINGIKMVRDPAPVKYLPLRLALSPVLLALFTRIGNIFSRIFS